MAGFSTALAIVATGAALANGAPLYETTAPLVYETRAGQDLVVPAGFVTDLASIPEAFHDQATPNGPWAAAAVIHDACYARMLAIDNRLECDLIFREALEESGVGERGVRSMYAAVRFAGGGAWRAELGWAPQWSVEWR